LPRFVLPPPALFALTTPPPPPSTLLPYTTLFRSKLRAHDEQEHHDRSSGVRWCRNGLAENTAANPADPLPFLEPSPQQRAQKRKDRKSTRLNSSHVKISYAVFCLKKKNNAATA